MSVITKCDLCGAETKKYARIRPPWSCVMWLFGKYEMELCVTCWEIAHDAAMSALRDRIGSKEIL